MASAQVIQVRIDALEEAIAAGVTRVSYDGKSVEYRSLEEMREIVNDLQTQLDGKPKRKQQRVKTSRGY